MGNSFVIIIRKGLYRFPAVYAVVLLCSGIVYEFCWVRSTESWSLIAILPALGFILAALGDRRRILLWIAAASFFFLIGRHIVHEQFGLGEDFNPSPAKCVVHASVRSLWASGDGLRIFIVEDAWNAGAGIPLSGSGRLTVRHNDIPIFAGDRLSFRTRLRKPMNRGNPGEYDWETDCRHNGVIWLASVNGPDSVVVTSRGSRWNPGAIVFQAREAMGRFLDLHSGKVSGSLQ